MDSLSPALNAALARLKYSPLTAIQLAAIPPALEGKDFYATSPTGTGKTAAFIVPILNRILTAPEPSKVRALILEPSRELTIQAANETRKIADGMGILTVAVYGGTNPAKQEELVAKGAQIVIGTNGRITEMLQSAKLKPSNYSILVLDEADRLFSEQFSKEVLHIASRLPPDRQTMLFSVQMQKAALAFGEQVMKKDYLRIHEGTVRGDTVSHSYVIADHKPRALTRMMIAHPAKSMIFCGTSKEAEEMVEELAKNKLYALVLHAHIKSERRHSAIKRFMDGRELLMVCTDVVARGIHVPNVDRVYSIGIPPSPEFYLHRAGRTGRMGRKGECVSIISEDEEKQMKEIYSSIGVKGEKR